ncbi:putative fgf receptor activating protein [Fasciolopsis buskii]|uniref:Putative fgf receptor activating protein n=1 Tax=Fasciolopsis buskii TaxID=27845 RepID=A0A8E0RQY5_9TREM|nr:putative fgf receptor activating protein [Fasciolopsis buski]
MRVAAIPKYLRPRVNSMLLLVQIASGLPIIALIICVSLCVNMNFGLSTHCTSANFLPSLSAAVSVRQPQRSTWLVAISISSLLRLALIPPVLASYQVTFGRILGEKYFSAIYFLFMMNTIEITFLLIMSMIPSSINYKAHRNTLAVFVLMSVLFMGLDSAFFHRLADRTGNLYLVRQACIKRKLLTAYLSTLAIVGTVYYIHTLYCPPYAYTLFSFFEYIAICLNVCYHFVMLGVIHRKPISAILDRPIRGEFFAFCDNILPL